MTEGFGHLPQVSPDAAAAAADDDDILNAILQNRTAILYKLERKVHRGVMA